MSLLDILTGDRLEEAKRNTERLVQETQHLISELVEQRSTVNELVKALRAHERTMKELLEALGGGK